MVRWLRSRFFFPLLALSVIAMSLYLAWRLDIGDWHGPRFHLNLFLAWVPYLLALAAVAIAERRPNARGLFRLSIVGWFFFFPNAPYLITDWRYLPGWTDELWYGMLMMTAFTMCGLLLAVVSLYLVHTVVAQRTSRRTGGVLAAAAIGLCGIGVYLGRFIRLNTWDLVTNPGRVAADVAALFTAHETHLGPLGFTVLFTLLLAGAYYLLLEVRHAVRSPEERVVWPVRSESVDSPED